MSGEEDFLHDQEEVRSLQTSNLKRVSDIANAILAKQNEIELTEGKLKELNAELKELTEKTLPDAMQEVGLRKFELEDGTEVGTRDEVFIGMPAEKKEACLNWLRDNGFGDLIKNEIKISLGMGDDEQAALIKRYLRDHNNEYDEKTTVLAQTLKAWAKEQDKKGNPIPEDLFAVHRVSVAKLKLPKR